MLTLKLNGLIGLCLYLVISQANAADCRPASFEPEHKKVRVLQSYPHHPDSFTQGLIYRQGYFYESIGRTGKSALLKVEAKSGTIVERFNNHNDIFAEGLTLWNQTLFQLSYRSGIGQRFGLDLRPKERFFYQHEGWGITSDGKFLIVSDGSEWLRFYTPEDFLFSHRICVRDQFGPVRQLNELEFIDGLIYANIWLKPSLATIEPESGFIRTYVNLKPLEKELRLKSAAPQLGSYNGIAYDVIEKSIYITGKLWPLLFKVDFK